MGKSKEELLHEKPLDVVVHNAAKVEDKAGSDQSVDINKKVDEANPNVFYQDGQEPLKLEPKADILNLVKEFSQPIKTPLFEAKISLDKMLNHIAEKTDFERRIELVNLVKPTLEMPEIIVKDGDRYKFFKRFLDDSDKEVKFLSIIEDDKGDFIGISIMKMKNTDIKNLKAGKYGEVVWGGDTPSATALHKDQSKSGSLAETIPQNTQTVNRDARLMEWSADSHPLTKNNDGTPKVFYHHTKADFDSFRENSFFTSDPELFEKRGDRTLPVFLNLRKPYVASVGEHKSYADFAALKNEGYDGFINSTGKVAVAFEPSQIKSIHNRGTFDEANPNVLYQVPQNTQTVKGGVRGMFENLGFKGVITLFENHDMTTVFHESAHYIETTFTKEERSAFDEAFGRYEAGRARSEAFAEGFVKWAATGEAKNSTIARVFEKTREFLKEVLSSLMNSKEAKFKLTASQELFYRAVFGDEEARAYLAKALEKREAKKTKETSAKSSDILYQDGESLSVEVVKNEFLKFASKALNDGRLEASFNLGVIKKTSADKIYKFTNGLINLAGYTREIKASEIRHIKNRHSQDLKYIGEIVNVLDNFEFAKATSYKEKTGKTTSGVMLYMRHPDGVLVGVELRDFGNKKVELKTFYMGDEAKIARDQELPLFLRLWTNEDYRSKNPLPYRPDTHSDGFMDKSIPQEKETLYQSAYEDGAMHTKPFMAAYNFFSDILRVQGKAGKGTKEFLSKVGLEKLYEAASRNLVYGGVRADEVIDSFSAYKIEQSARSNKSAEVYKHLQKLSKEDRENLHLVLSGDSDIATLKPSLESTYKSLRNIIDQNAKELIALGELKADEAIEHYLARTYQKDVQEATSLQNSIFSSGGSVDHIKARRGKEDAISISDNYFLEFLKNLSIKHL